ncbi:SDR family NAD(P)-dependent oxidoreductase [Streptomyces lavendulae]|uniref:SDR family NAD(P)-dependent oxidoreductase n=1 Tax=Streptomyces lavendulae TaxID=1914 RepID=UPI0036A70BED
MKTPRIALVTGANQGLGRALVEGLAARAGADDVVLLTGRDERRVTEAAREVALRPGTRARVEGRVLDVTDTDAIDRLADELAARHGGVDVVKSKTANVLFAVEATRRWAQDGITANAVMPGAVLTNLQRHTDGGRGSGTVPAELMKTVGQGAATAVLVATSPLLEGVGGRYFADCNEAEVLDRRGAPLLGVARYALDPAGARHLWTLSEAMLADAAGA